MITRVLEICIISSQYSRMSMARATIGALETTSRRMQICCSYISRRYAIEWSVFDLRGRAATTAISTRVPGDNIAPTQTRCGQ